MERILEMMKKEEIPYDKEKAFDILVDIGLTKNKYDSFKKQRVLTKQHIIDIVVPFRDKYKLSDDKALAIIKDKMSIKKACDIAIELSKR
ncbi:MAG: hypothetical protein DBY41_06805 [Clostridium sp.]|nr:MAG: hypothetical protein DBY41_06805 [Clostridium sp.]